MPHNATHSHWIVWARVMKKKLRKQYIYYIFFRLSVCGTQCNSKIPSAILQIISRGNGWNSVFHPSIHRERKRHCDVDRMPSNKNRVNFAIALHATFCINKMRFVVSALQSQNILSGGVCARRISPSSIHIACEHSHFYTQNFSFS